MKRVMVFIDGNNFESAVNALYGSQTRIKYGDLAEMIAAKKCGGNMQRVYFYTAKSNRDPEKAKNTQRFADSLNKKTPKCIAKVGFLQYIGKDQSGKELYNEKGTDVNIAVDLVSLAYTNAYDEAVLLSADTDYKPAIEVVRNLGKNVIACLVDQQTGGLMKELCDDHIILKKSDLEQVKI